MEVVNLRGQGTVLDTEILRNVINGLCAILRIVLKSLETRSDKGEDFGWIGSDLFLCCPDSPRRITVQVVARIGELTIAFAIEDQLSRRTEKTGGDMAGA